MILASLLAIDHSVAQQKSGKVVMASSFTVDHRKSDGKNIE